MRVFPFLSHSALIRHTHGQREKVNYTIHYEIDDEAVGTVLRTSEYGGDEDMAWVLLAALPADGEGP